MPLGYTSPVLTQYLMTASRGNVIAEFASQANRWRVICTRCGATFTFSEGEQIEREYVKYGTLDQSLQNFVKEHRHEHPILKVKLAPVMVESPELPKRKTSGRKFR